MISPLVCDLTGRTQTWLWLLQTFGHVEYHPATPLVGQPIYRITRLSAGVTGQLLTATVLDEDGRRLPRTRVVRAWTQSPLAGSKTLEDPRRSPSGARQGTHAGSEILEDPQLGTSRGAHGSDLPWLLPTADRPLGVADPLLGVEDPRLGNHVTITDAQGLAEFPTLAADLYTLPAVGRSTLWIANREAPSDAISGIGILQSDLGLRLCLHITWKRMHPPGAQPHPRRRPVR